MDVVQVFLLKLGDNSANMNVETVPTGSLSLDIALGLGGLPKGRIIEIYGPESSGKTTVALHCVAEVQKRGGIAGFIDAEHALDPVYAKNIGVDIDNLYISQPDCGEQALEITETMVRSGAVDIVIVDSVAALVLFIRSIAISYSIIRICFFILLFLYNILKHFHLTFFYIKFPCYIILTFFVVFHYYMLILVIRRVIDNKF